MIINSPDLLNRISEWRRKAANGTLTTAEMKEAIIVLRQGRVTAAASERAPSRKKPAKSADDLLAELDL